MCGSGWLRWHILLLPLFAASGLALLGLITLDKRTQKREVFEARLVNEILGREPTAARNWETMSALVAHPQVRRIRAQQLGSGTAEVWLGWRESGGYAGPVDLAVGFDDIGRITQVRLLRHTETPGLGDRLEHQNSDWLTQFRGIVEPAKAHLRARQGQIDAMSGATITSAAVARGVARSLSALLDTRRQD